MAEVTLDGSLITSMSELHDAVSEALGFPEWYGRNLDALYDCLTSPAAPCRITVTCPALLRQHLGEKADALFDVLLDAAAQTGRVVFSMEE